MLGATAVLAATNRTFGQARDSLWKQASRESVFDDAKTLLGANPALQTDAIKSLTSMISSDGSLNTTVGQLETLIRGSIAQIDNQNCTLASGTSGASPSNCASGALHDAQFVAAQCPNGTDTATGRVPPPATKRRPTRPTELRFITSAQAAAAAEGDALSDADQALGQAETAEGQAAAQIADEENQYLDYQNAQQFEKAGFDVATLAVTLSVSEIDPVAAFRGLFNVVGDASDSASADRTRTRSSCRASRTSRSSSLTSSTTHSPRFTRSTRSCEPVRSDCSGQLSAQRAAHPGPAADHAAGQQTDHAAELRGPSPVEVQSLFAQGRQATTSAR